MKMKSILMKPLIKWNDWLDEDFIADSIGEKVFVTLMALIIGIPITGIACVLMTIWQVDLVAIIVGSLIYGLIKLFRGLEKKNENKNRWQI